MWFECLIIFVLIVANGFFSLAELAVLSANRARLKVMEKRGVRGATAAIALAEDSENFLPAAQACITLLSAFAGVFSGATMAEPLGAILNQIPFINPHGDAVALPIVVAIISYLSMVIGELVPKHIAISHAERWAALFAPFLRGFVKFLGPVVRVLRWSMKIVLRLLRLDRVEAPSVSEEEVAALVDEGAEGGVFEASEQQMLKRVLRLADRPVRAIMTARGDVNWLNVMDDEAKIIETICSTRHSVYPVCDNALDQIVGVVHSKDLLLQHFRGEHLNLRAVTQEPTIIPDTASILSIFEKIKQTAVHMGIVVDEYGTLEGIVTELDFMEAIVGVMPDDNTGQLPQQPEADDNFILDGSMPIDEMKERLSLAELPNEDTFHTLGGIVMGALGHVPREGDTITFGTWQLEVTEMDNRRVDKVKALRQETEVQSEV